VIHVLSTESQMEQGNGTLKQRPMSAPDRISVEPFKCGTLCTDFNKMATRRRKDYGEAIRKYICRPKTATAFFG
jgi:polyisoprenoid-binding protein YceI